MFDLVRERLGPRFGLANLGASFFINLLTLTAEIAGVAIAISLVASVNYLLLIPFVAVLVWLVVWRMPFETMERVFGLLGLCLLVFAVAVWKIGPDWGELLSARASSRTCRRARRVHVRLLRHRPVRRGDDALRGVLLLQRRGGGRLDDEGPRREPGQRAHRLPARRPAVAGDHGLRPPRARAPRTSASTSCRRSRCRSPSVVGKLGLAVVLVGIFAATFGAALETALSAGYIVAQYLGWPWGKHLRPRQASRFHVVVLMAIVAAMLIALSGVDPVKVTEYSIVLSAAALPLTYFPILVIANDPDYMGDEHTNGRFLNTIATVYLVILVVVSVATIPLMIITKAGA